MKISLFLGFQGGDWLHNDTPGSGGPPTIRDGQVYEDNIYIADLLEPLGFDALFQVEHHGSPYHMTSNPLAILYYMAGRTERLEMGTCVVVLPWNNPAPGGRGALGPRQHAQGSPDPHRRRQGELSQRVPLPRESIRTKPASGSRRVSRSSGWRSARRTSPTRGRTTTSSGATTRPRPRSLDAWARQIYGALVSKSSLEPVAEMGLDLMCTGGTSVATMTENCAIFNSARARVGLGPTRPIIAAPGLLRHDDGRGDGGGGARLRRVHRGITTALRIRQPAAVRRHQGLSAVLAGRRGAIPAVTHPATTTSRAGSSARPTNASRRSACTRRSPVRTTS